MNFETKLEEVANEVNKMKRYEVNCVEHGEFFHFVMESNETNPDKVMEQAQDDASLWGAEVMFVKPTEEEV